MSSTYTPSQAIAIAQQERALTRPNVIDANNRNPWGTQHVLPLMQLTKLIDRLPLSKEMPCKVGRGNPPVLRVTSQGQRLHELLLFLAPWLEGIPSALRFDPRLQTLVDIARPPQLQVLNMEAMPQWARIRTFDGMNGIVQDLRDLTSTRGFVRRLVAYEARVLSGLKRVRKYFGEVAKADPQAVVMRIELRTTEGADDSWRTIESSSDQFGSWFDAVSRTHGKNICGSAWKLDHDPIDGNILHATLIVKDTLAEHREAALQSVRDIWQAIAGETACVLNCNAPEAKLQFRGCSDDDWGSSIREELDRAAIYLVSTDLLYYWDFGPEYPTFGYGMQRPQMVPF